MVGGYLGIWWTARNLGLSRQLAILPGLTFATTPYVLSEMYGRGAWAELVAVNAAAVVFGAVTALLWRPEPARSRGPALAALVAASALVAGTHNITLMLSVALLPLMLLALLPLRGRSRTPIVPELGWAVAAVALGVGTHRRLVAAQPVVRTQHVGRGSIDVQEQHVRRDLRAR